MILQVANGKDPALPSASDMNELFWDDEIAEIGQRWVEQCQFQMQHDICRDTRKGESVGQNLASVGSSGGFKNRISTIKKLVQTWSDESFDKSQINKWWEADFGNIGHDTQLLWANTTHVGCGLYTNRGEMKLACNYKPAGNVLGTQVYTVGETASKCNKPSDKYPGLCKP